MRRGALGYSILLGFSVHLLFLLSCAPPLRIEEKGKCVIVDVQRLGEYYTIVDRMELKEKHSGKVIWSARARTDTKPQMYDLEFCEGRNDLAPNVRGDAKLMKFVAAEGGDSFYLLSGKEYVLEVESPSFTRHASKAFVLGEVGNKG